MICYIKAFKELNNRLIFALNIYYYNLDFKLKLETNALDRVIVGILLQPYLNSKQYPITSFLKIIALAKYKYEVYNKEMPAIV